jgi:hypothetical protein
VDACRVLFRALSGKGFAAFAFMQAANPDLGNWRPFASHLHPFLNFGFFRTNPPSATLRDLTCFFSTKRIFDV